jgi:hypothetical protein
MNFPRIRYFLRLAGLMAMAIFFSVNIMQAQTKKVAKTKDKVTATDSASVKKDSSKMLSHVIKKCTKIEGLFNLYQDTSEGKLYMEVSADKIGKEYIHFFHAENGSLNAGWLKGSYGWESILKIEKYFDRIEFIGQNPHYYFDPENPLSKSANADINNPIVSMSKITAMNEGKDTFLIEADGVFLTEALAQLKYLPTPGSKQKNPFNIGNLSKDKTKYSLIKNYPNNVNVVVDYAYENPYPTNFGINTVTDPRYITIKVQHNLIEMPQNDYQPRYDDPRVGYFTTQVTDQTSTSVAPYKDLIHRWHLKKKDPTAEVSEPVEPIVYWMENTTPYELRPIIKKAVESWNMAYEKAGFKNAVVVKQQPDDATWDAGDIRYNVLRWTSAPMMGSAWGPSFVNPRTGQILGADIMLDYVFIRGLSTLDKLHGVDSKSLDQLMFEKDESQAGRHQHSYLCEAADHRREEFLFGNYVGKALDYSEEQLSTLKEEMIMELLLHEVGHTLGLNHNFKSSQLHSPEKINDKSLTSKSGLTGSVMDYNPFNLALDKSKQGQFLSTVPGPYDLWAIEYGYTTSTTQEALDNILMRSTEPELVFGNDADAMGSPGMGIDPTIIRWDMTNDVIRYGEDRIKLSMLTMDNLKEQLSEDGQSHQELLVGYNTVMRNYFGALNIIKHYVGGVTIDRAMNGQANAGKPFTPVDYKVQKKAMDALVQYGFSPEAFMAPNDLYPYLQMQRRGFNFWGRTEDPKIHDRIAMYQKILLSHLLHPVVLKRMSDTRYYGNVYSVNKMMSDLTDGIFEADLKGNVTTVRQNLQHIYLDGLLAALNNSKYDQVSRSSILNEVLKIKSMMKSNKGKEEETRAHRKHMMHKIEKALGTSKK